MCRIFFWLHKIDYYGCHKQIIIRNFSSFLYYQRQENLNERIWFWFEILLVERLLRLDNHIRTPHTLIYTYATVYIIYFV